MEKVTYLLGAGASSFRLPLLKNINEDLINFSNDFLPNITSEIANINLQELETYGSEVKIKPEKILEIYCKDLTDLASRIDSNSIYNSIDAYANALIQRGDQEEYNRVRSLFSTYLHLKQFLKVPEVSPVDRRYTDFFLKLRDGFGNIQKNVNVLSWNYDVQLELAYSKLYNYEFHDTYDYLNYFDKTSENKKTQNFNIYKLNGSSNILSTHNRLTNYLDKRDYQFYDYNDKLITLNLLRYIYKAYLSMKSYMAYKTNLDFSWSYGRGFDTVKNNNYLGRIINNVGDTKTLVVIGYSFHQFNSAVDIFLLDSLKNIENIYIQDPYPEQIISTIKSFRLEHLSKVNFEPINISNNLYRGFFLPNSLLR